MVDIGGQESPQIIHHHTGSLKINRGWYVDIVYLIYILISSNFSLKMESKYQNSQMLRRQSRNERWAEADADSSRGADTWFNSSSCQLQTLGRVSACLKERMVATEQMIMMRMEVRNTECSTRSLAEMLGTRQLLIWREISRYYLLSGPKYQHAKLNLDI